MTSVAARKPKQDLPPITPAMRKNVETLVKKAKVKMVINQPFYSNILFNRPIVISDTCSTAYVTLRGKIVVGTRFVNEHNVDHTMFLLAHEAMHHAFQHVLRRLSRTPRKWNIACDAVINDLLIESSVGEPIPGGVYMPGSRNKTAEQVYAELPDPPDGESGYESGEGFDDLDESDQLTDAEAREMEQQVRVELAAAARVAKAQGKLPASLERVVEEIVNPVTPWHKLLERFMTAFVKADYSWRRPNKRHIANGLYLPSTDRLPQMGVVAIARDTSGSCMGASTQEHFLGHINAILELCRPEKVILIDCDAAVEGVQEFGIEELPINPKRFPTKGGGGTSFAPPFEYLRKEGIEPEVFVYLTDMWGGFPEDKPPYPVVWLSTSDVKEAPFGDVIQYTVE